MSSDALIGRTLGNYEILDRLGKGGMAVVYRARQITMQRDVAIKVMSADLAGDPQFVARFEREAQVIANLQHPRILPVHDFGHEGDIFYLVMRVIEGSTLYQRLTDGPLSLALTGRFVNQMAEALDYAHSQGVVHRDLKPNNILIDEWDNLYLMHFGLAKMLASSTHLTASGAVLGTPAYMAPEQWRGEAIDARSDVYALGVILYEMVTGRTPFQSDTPYTLMFKHIHDAPPPPRGIVPDLPEAVEAVMLRALAKDKSARYPSAGDLAREFSTTLQNCQVQGCDVLTPPLTPVVLRGEARPASDPSLPPAQEPAQIAPPVPESIAPPEQITPPEPSVPQIPVPGQPPAGVRIHAEIDDQPRVRTPRKVKTPGENLPEAPEWVERLHGSVIWQGAMEALETALERAAESAPVDARNAGIASGAGAEALLRYSMAYEQMSSVLRAGETLVGVLDVRGTKEWRLWQKLVIGGLAANVLGGIINLGLLSMLGLLAWVFVFVQAVRTWRGIIGRYYLGFTSDRVIVLPRDAEGEPVLQEAQAAAWGVIDSLRLTKHVLRLEVPNPGRRDFHFVGLVLAQGDGGLGAQSEWLPGSALAGLIADQGFSVADELL